MGKDHPNLVLIYDSEYGHEFRVQCEVRLTPTDAARVATWLQDRTKESLNNARDLVLAEVSEGASATFKRIIREAFADQP